MFRYEINSVQYPHQMTFALINGMGGYWWDRLDHRGLSSLIEEIYKNFPASEEHPGLPLSLSTAWKRISSLGILFYSSRQAKINGKQGKALSLVYACSRNGFQAAVDLHQATYGRTLYVFGKIPIAINFFPQRFSIGRQINQPKGDNVVNFAPTSITSNHDHCNSKFKSILVEHLTDNIFEDTTHNNMKQLYSEIVGVIPSYTNAAGKESSKDAIYSGLIVLHKNAETMSRTATFFANMFQIEVPSIFPISADEEDDNEGFTTVQSKYKKPDKPPTIADIFRASMHPSNWVTMETANFM
jgi:hypothetical protein